MLPNLMKEIVFSTNGAGKLDIYVQPPLHPYLKLYKNSYTKWILELDVKHKTTQLLEKKYRRKSL